MQCLDFFRKRIQTEDDRAAMCVALETLTTKRAFVVTFGGAKKPTTKILMEEDDAKSAVKEAAFELFAKGELGKEAPDVKLYAPQETDSTLFDLHFILEDDRTKTPLILRYHHGMDKFSYHVPKAASHHETLAELADAVSEIMNTLVLRGHAGPSDNPVT
jgi:hypothetical protein